MKKLSFKFAFAILLVCLAAGCKSAPVTVEPKVEVNPLDLLDDKSSFYLAVPSSVDPDLIVRIIQNNIDSIADSDAKTLAGRINKVYLGLNRRKNTTELQCSIDGNIPLKYVPSLMSSKNGWENRLYTDEISGNSYKVYSQDDIDISFPTSKIICLGRDIDSMLHDFDFLSNDFDSDLSNEENINHLNLSDDLFDYLNDAQTDIRFFANKPASFLTILTGAQLNLQLIDVRGSFTVDPKHDDQYLLSIEFNFKSEKYLKAGKSMLALAFSLANGQEEMLSNTVLKINNIKLKKEQLYKILVL